MLLVPLLVGLSPWKAKGSLPDFQWYLYAVLLVLIIGFRYEVGGDWQNYIQIYADLKGLSLFEGLIAYRSYGDYGFLVSHWFSMNYLNGIYSTNLFCATIFVVGLLRICKSMPIPWLSLTVSIPYLVIVVGMGYTRQAAALGFIMWGLIDLMNGRYWRFYLMVILGTFFHKTALFMLPIGFLSSNSIRNPKDIVVFFIVSAVAFIALLADQFQAIVFNYISNNGDMESSGAFIRVIMNVFVAIIFFIYRKQWKYKYRDQLIWVVFSVVSLIMLPLTFVISTTIDRVALYLLPMQFIVLSRVPLLINDIYYRTLFVIGVVLIYIGVMFVWLNYGKFSGYWVPYQNILFK